MKTPEQIMAALNANVDHALGSAALYFALKLRETVGVQAMLVPGSSPPIAMFPASPGAPPRRVSGRLQGAVAVRHLSEGVWQVGVYGVLYARTLEDAINHRFIEPTLAREIGQMREIVGQDLRAARVT